VHVLRLTLAVVACSLSHQGFDVLIGRDLLDGTALFYNGPGRTFTWSL
jgi:hypothetical protein